MSGKPRIRRDELVPLLRDPAIASRDLALRLGYTRSWITQLRGRLGVQMPSRGGDRRSATWRDKLYA